MTIQEGSQHVGQLACFLRPGTCFRERCAEDLQVEVQEAAVGRLHSMRCSASASTPTQACGRLQTPLPVSSRPVLDARQQESCDWRGATGPLPQAGQEGYPSHVPLEEVRLSSAYRVSCRRSRSSAATCPVASKASMQVSSAVQTTFLNGPAVLKLLQS